MNLKEELGILARMFYCNLFFLNHKPAFEESGYYTKCVRCGISMYVGDEYIMELDPYCNCKNCISCNYYKSLE